MFDFARGGNDIFIASGGENSHRLYGDAGGDFSGHVAGGNDTFTLNGVDDSSLIYGDAGGNMSSFAHGGNDTLNDSELSGLNSHDVFYGDAGGNMSGFAQGGNDTFVKGDGTIPPAQHAFIGSIFYGDAGGDMSDHAKGGNDVFQSNGPTIQAIFYGDAGGNMGDRAVGGDDTFIGPNMVNGFFHLTSQAYGDAQTISGNAQGGDDTLIGGNDPNPPAAGTYDTILVGDAQTMSDNARGGNDTLSSGTGNDDMWGDAQVILGLAKGGNDTFVFNFDNGHDKIEDFGQGLAGAGSNWGTDHVDVSALGISDFSQLNISSFDSTTHESTITFSPGNDVVVHSQEALRPQDFLFEPHGFLLN
jgi:hypothetical protein